MSSEPELIFKQHLFNLDQRQFGIVGHQYVDVGLKIIAALHGQNWNLDLVLEVHSPV